MGKMAQKGRVVPWPLGKGWGRACRKTIWGGRIYPPRLSHGAEPSMAAKPKPSSTATPMRVR